MRHISGNHGGEFAGVLLEAALSLPLLLIVIAGFVEFGFAFRERTMLTECLRVTARIAAQQPELDWDGNLTPEENIEPMRDALQDVIDTWIGNMGLDPAHFTTSIEGAAMVFGTEVMPFVRITIDRKTTAQRSVLWPTISVSSCVTTFASARIGGDVDDIPLEANLADVCN